MTTETSTRQKRSRPVVSKDKNPRKRINTNDGKDANTLLAEENKNIVATPEAVQSHDIIETTKDVMDKIGAEVAKKARGTRKNTKKSLGGNSDAYAYTPMVTCVRIAKTWVSRLR
ncbi:hypothetical protein PIB30_092624 [Stylosanthes scabra]|uniref:Uncharacterized protein n=1 Tax=Stylosanthes scabra TaxID=79078 RepID=A0ABU6XXF6_9FABA|nr:hypothetical protein [Stylosanthes scabra]